MSRSSPSKQLALLYRQALEQVDDAIYRVQGHTEARLSQNPGDRQALMFKGSLLTLLGDGILSPAKKVDYIKMGIRLMTTAIGDNGAYPTTATELALVRATTLAILPDQFEQQATAFEALCGVVAARDFDSQDQFYRVRALTLLACLHQAQGEVDEAKALFKTARACDQSVAIRTYSDWMGRQ